MTSRINQQDAPWDVDSFPLESIALPRLLKPIQVEPIPIPVGKKTRRKQVWADDVDLEALPRILGTMRLSPASRGYLSPVALQPLQPRFKTPDLSPAGSCGLSPPQLSPLAPRDLKLSRVAPRVPSLELPPLLPAELVPPEDLADAPQAASAAEPPADA